MKNKILIMTFLASVFLALMPAVITAGAGTSSMDVLKVPSGLKSQAMGGAYAGLSDDLEAIETNAAGLGFIEGNDILFIQDLYLDGVLYDSLYYARGMGDAGTIGFAGKYLNGGTITEALEAPGGGYGGEGNSVSAADFSGVVAYGCNIGKFAYSDFTKNLNAGAAIKFSGEMIGKDYGNFSASVDLGAIYTVIIEDADFMSNRGEFVWNKAGFGLSFRNLGASIAAGITPISIAAGAYTQLLNVFSGNNRVRIAADADYNMDNGINIKAGLEYMHLLGDYTLALRTGGNINPADRLASGMSFGGGVGMKAGGATYSIDYVFMPYSELGSSQKIGLYISFK